MKTNLTTALNRFWTEQDGAIVSAEIVLIGTILVIGMIVGLTSVRDSVVTELADFAQAIANVNQSFCYSGVNGHDACTSGSSFVDLLDFCDSANSFSANVQQSKCVNVCVAAGSEGQY